MPIMLHITTRDAWEHAQKQGVYVSPSLATEGFIHCSTPAQTVATAARYFRGVAGLVLLSIDESAVSAPVRYEAPSYAQPSEPGELFPHLYGPLDLEAVIRVDDFPPKHDGSFELPAGVGRGGA